MISGRHASNKTSTYDNLVKSPYDNVKSSPYGSSHVKSASPYDNVKTPYDNLMSPIGASNRAPPSFLWKHVTVTPVPYGGFKVDECSKSEYGLQVVLNVKNCG